MNQQRKFLLGFFPSHTDDDMSTPTFPITTTTSMLRNHNTAEQCPTVRSSRNERIEMRRTNVNNSRENQKNREEKFERTEQINRFTHSVTSFLAHEQYNCPNSPSSMANYFPHHSHYSRQYEPSYPSITRFRTSVSSSPYRKTHYLDDSDEEILNEEIVETTDLDHYPTLNERWGEDTKIHRRYDGDLIIEDYVEFEEIEPTIIEEISYEIDYQNNQIQSSREIHHTRSESRNFRRIKKRRTKRKRTQAFSPVSHSTDSTNENFSRPPSTTTTTTHANLSALINSIPLANIDLIEQDISSENFQSIEQQINQSHISANDVSTRISPISNDKYIQIPEKDVASKSIDSQISAQRINPLERRQIDERMVRNDKPFATISTPVEITKTFEEALKQTTDSNENRIPNDTTEEICFDQSAILSPRQMEEDEYVELSSDSSVDISRQIQNTATIAHLPSIDQTEQFINKSIEDTHPSESINNTQSTIAEHAVSKTLEISNQTPLPVEQKPLLYPWKTSIETTQIPTENATDPETDFNRFLEDRYFPSMTDEETLSSSISSDNEKNTTTDLMKMYYELREQRHSQPIPDRTQIESKQEISTDHEEYMQNQLFPTITNLPSREYRQVFGVSDEVINTINELTSSAEQTVQVRNFDDNTPATSIVSSEKEDVNDEQTTTNAELDLRYSVLLDRMSALLRPLIDSSSTSVITEAKLVPSSSDDNGRERESVEQIKLSASTSCEQQTMSDDEKHQQIIDTSNVTNPITTIVSKLTSGSVETELTEQANTSVESEIQTSVVTSEEMTTKENENEQETSSTGLLNMVKNLLPSTLLPKTSAETNAAIEQQQDQVPESLHQINSTTLQSTTANQAESNNLFDLVGNALSNIKETISHLVTSDDKTSEPTNTSDKSDSHLEQSMSTGVTGEVISNTDEEKISTEKLIFSNSTDEFPVAVSQPAHPTTAHDTQEPQIEKKPSYEPLQTVSNDYPSNINYDSIANTEATLAQSLQQLNSSHESASMATDMQSVKESSENNSTQNTESEIKHDQEDDGFRLVQRRKRITSSTIHDKSTSSTTDSFGPDIDLKPVVLQGNSNTAISSRPIISQTTDTTPKKKRQKSKKNDKKEMILYDAPELSINLAPSQQLESESIRLNSTVPSEGQKTDALSLETPSIQTEDQDKKELPYQSLQVINDDYPWYFSHYSITDAEARFAQFYEHTHHSVETASLPANTQSFDESSETISIENTRFENDNDRDDTGFQTVQRRKRIPSSTTNDKLASSLTTTTNPTLSLDIDLKPIILHGNPHVTIPARPIISETIDTTPKQKRQKSKKKDKKEMILYDAPDLSMNLVHSHKPEDEQEVLISTVSADHETTLAASQQTLPIQNDETKSPYQPLQVISDDYPWYASHYSIIEAETRFSQVYPQLHHSDQALSSSANTHLLAESVEKTVVESAKVQEEHDQDDTGFQIVQRRKRIPSSTIHEKPFSSINDVTDVPVSPDIDLKPVLLHGNPNAPISHRSLLSQAIDATPKKKRQKSKKNDKKEMILYDAPELPVNLMSSQTTRDEHEQLISLIDTQDQKTDHAFDEETSMQIDDGNEKKSLFQSSQVIIDESPGKAAIRNAELQNEHEHDDADFQIVQRRKRIPSSTVQEKHPSSSDANEVPASPDIDLKPVILRGNPNAPISSVPIISERTDIIPKKKRKKSKNKDKKEMILYNAPEPTKDEQEQLISLIDTQDQKMDTVFDEETSMQIDNENEKKSSFQSSIVINDDHSQLNRYDSIADSELMFAQSHEQLHLSNQTVTLPANAQLLDESSGKTAMQNAKLQDEHDQDEAGFQIVQRRKRIPSSTVHEKQHSSKDANDIPASSDIDLKPVILSGNPTVLIPSTPIVSETTDTTQEKKRKKSKNKHKKEMILYDAPELTLTSMVSQTIADDQMPLIPAINSEDQKTNIASVETVAISIGNENETHLLWQPLQVLNDDYPWYSSHYLIIDAEIRFAQFYEQFQHHHEVVSQPSNAQVLNESSKAIVMETTELENEHVQDDADFQLVQRRKRIPSSTAHEKTMSSNIEDVKIPVSPDIDLKPIILHGNPNAPIPSIPIISGTTDTAPKKKRKKSKNKDKKEMILYDAPEPTKDEYEQLISFIDTQDQKMDTVFDEETSIQIDNENEKKPLFQPSPVINDDHPQLNRHDSTAESEVKSAQSLDESSGKTTMQNAKLQDEHDHDDAGFQIVQRRKRIPSSTIHEKHPSSSDTIKVPVSPDIDLKPIVLHGNPNVPIPPTPIVSKTTDTTSKKKRKKSKKNDEKEAILYDAPESTVNITQSHRITDESVQLISTGGTEDQKTENLFDETPSMEINDQKSTVDPSGSSSIVQSVLPTMESTTKITRVNIIPSSKKEEEDEDNEGFQLVRYRGRILSAPKPEQPTAAAITSSVMIDRDVEPKTTIAHEDSSSLLAKKKGNKHKKQKKDEQSSISIDSATIEHELNAQSDDPSSPVVEHSNIPSQSISSMTTTTKVILPKPPVPQADEEEEDNDGFQLVTYRKRMTSAPRSANIPSSPSTKTRYERPVNRTVDQNRFAFHGRHGSPSPSVSHTTPISKSASNQNIQVKTRQDKRQISSSYTPPRSVSVETSTIIPVGASNTSRPSKNIKPKVVHEQHAKETKSDQLVAKNEPIQQITEAISTTNQPTSSIVSNVTDTSVEKSTDQNDRLLRIPVPQTLALPDTKHTKISTTNEDNTHSLPVTKVDSTPLSVEEMVDQNTSISFVPTSESETIPPSTSSTTDPPVEEPIDSPNESQNQQDSIQFTTSLINEIEEIPKLSDEPANQTNDRTIINQAEREELVPQTAPAVILESTITAEKPVKRRKKRSQRKEKGEDEPVLTPPAAIHIEPSSDAIQPEYKVKETTGISSNTSTTLSEEVSSKLDLFLPEYMRQQINTPQPSSSLPTWSKTTSSEVISKKKSRSKLLTKDHEAKSLLTNELDHQTLSTDTSDIQQTSSFDAESSLQSISSIGSNQLDPSSSQSVDNILSRGFYLWLQESQSLSQQKVHPDNIMQNIVIQSSEIPEEDDCWNVSKVHGSTYMTGIQANKQIHLMNAYSINHPHSISTPSWLIRQSHDKTFSDKLDTFDSGHEDDSFTDESKKSTDTKSNSSHLSHPFVKSSQQHLEKNFDDWAHFYPSKTTHSLSGNLSRPLEYFYTQTFDEDTLLSAAIPNQHSMKSKQQQRYGDFHPSNIVESTLKCPSSKLKPSNYFQKSISTFSESNDDEILISHSSTGLSRRV